MRKRLTDVDPMANPFDSEFGGKPGNDTNTGSTRNPGVSYGGKKQAMSVTVSTDVLEKLRDVAYFEPGATISSLVEQGAKELIEKLERERGEPYPSRDGKPVPTGRRAK